MISKPLSNQIRNLLLMVAILSVLLGGGCIIALIYLFPAQGQTKELSSLLQANLLVYIGLLFAILIIACVAAVVLANKLAAKLSGGISEAVDVVQNLTRGNNASASDTIAFEEIGQLYDALSEMSGTFNESYRAIEAGLAREKLISDFVLGFSLHPGETIQNDVETTMTKLKQFAKADFASLYFSEANEYDFIRTYRLLHSSSPSANDKLISDTAYPWMFFMMSKGSSFSIGKDMQSRPVSQIMSDVRIDFPWLKKKAGEMNEYLFLTENKLQQLVCLPVFEASECIGFVILGFVNNHIKPSIDDIQLYSLLAGNILKSYAFHQKYSHLESDAESLNLIIASFKEAVIVTGADGVIKMINPPAEKMTGWVTDKAIGLPLREVFKAFDTATKEPLNNLMSPVLIENRSLILEKNTTLVSLSGDEFSIAASLSPIRKNDNTSDGILLVFREISEKSNTGIEELKAQKLEAVSFLSAGLAHDFNNLLTAILGNISLAMEELPPKSEAAMLLRAAEESTLKGKDITNQLLTFANGSSPEPTISNVSLLLEHIVRILTDDTKVKVSYQIENGLPQVSVAPEYMDKIITNLVTNALQAIPEIGGELIVRAQICTNVQERDLPLKLGKYICIHILDNGRGIAPENLSRIFIPYFTTRSDGSGLGLPTVYSLLKKHNGHIRINSQLGKGTDCEIYLPVGESNSPQKPVDAEPVNKAPAQSHILIMEGEPFLRDLLDKTLCKMGIFVETASDPDELMVLYKKATLSTSPISVIIMDLNIPSDVDILDLANQFRRLNDNLKLIGSCSYVDKNELEEYKTKGFDDILPKPFHINELKDIVSRNL